MLAGTKPFYPNDSAHEQEGRGVSSERACMCVCVCLRKREREREERERGGGGGREYYCKTIAKGKWGRSALNLCSEGKWPISVHGYELQQGKTWLQVCTSSLHTTCTDQLKPTFNKFTLI